MNSTIRSEREIKHFSDLEHIWWGAKTVSGQKRYDKRFNLFKKLCSPSKNSKILEIGCGDGEFTKRLVKTKSKIIGTDITPAVVKRARKGIKGAKFAVGDAEKFAFKDNTFDIICGISILHHVNYLKSFEECYRVLKKGGTIFFSEPNYLNPIIYVALHSTWLKTRMEYSPDETALVRWEIAKVLTMIGFSNVKVYNYDFLHPSTPSFLSPFVESISPSLESMPFIKETSGSIIIWAKK